MQFKHRKKTLGISTRAIESKNGINMTYMLIIKYQWNHIIAYVK